MPTNRTRYKLNQSLLSAWQYSFITEDGYDSFYRTLSLEKDPPTQAMLDGIQFENCVNSALDGDLIPETHILHKPVKELQGYLNGATKQVSVFKDVTVDGVNFLLHGYLDYLRNGVIYDTKFSKTYHCGKYYKSPQHPMYFALVPEAEMFQYIICDGQFIYKETYYPQDTTSIIVTIKQFMRWMEKAKLIDLYVQNWKVPE